MPSSKVTAAAITGAVMTGLAAVAAWAGYALPAEVTSAVAVLVGAVVAYYWPETRPAPSAVDAVLRR
jgi:hypothetical protein